MIGKNLGPGYRFQFLNFNFSQSSGMWSSGMASHSHGIKSGNLRRSGVRFPLSPRDLFARDTFA